MDGGSGSALLYVLALSIWELYDCAPIVASYHIQSFANDSMSAEA